MKPSAITAYTNIPRVDCFCQFFAWFISFILSRKPSIALPIKQSSSPSPPPQPGILKLNTPRRSSGNRRRAREVIEVTGSNHAMGVILNLAWGPNNFSPSMIWNWRSRSNSQTGLGAEELLPAELVFCSCCVFFFFPYYHHFHLLFPFSLFSFSSSFVFRATLLIVIYILNPVVFSVAQKSPANTIFPLNRNSFFSLTVLCIFLPPFFLWRFLCIIHFKLVILR